MAVVMTQAAETWVLASSEKLSAASPYVVASCQQATGLIVEHRVAKKVSAPFEKLGLAIVRA